jgi:NADPH-dependent 2,4-dienoyl-CoA reductase/sulfur reductase-like enzyme
MAFWRKFASALISQLWVRCATQMQQQLTVKSIVVVGGGITGLVAAYYAKKEGGDRVNVTLVECEQKLGGHSIIVDVNGQMADVGFQVLNKVVRSFRDLVEILIRRCCGFNSLVCVCVCV